MPGSKNVKCPKCLRSFSKRQLGNHVKICDGISIPKDERYDSKCPFCQEFMLKRNLEKHKIICKTKHIIINEKFLVFLNFIFTLVLKANNTIKRKSYVGNKNEKKSFIYNNKIKQILCNEIGDEKDNKIKEEEINFFKDKNYISNNKIFYNVMMKKICKNDNEYEKQGQMPLISFRQIITDFKNNLPLSILKEYRIDLYYMILNMYAARDYKMDYEIENLEEVKKLRNSCKLYNEKKEFILDLFNKFFRYKDDEFYCDYCRKYVLYKFNHLILCNEYKNAFKENKIGAINYVLNYILINELKKSGKEYEEVVNYFENSNVDEFLKEIKIYLNKKNYLEFKEKKMFLKKKRENYDIFNILREIEKIKDEKIKYLKKKKKIPKELEEKEKKVHEFEIIDNKGNLLCKRKYLRKKMKIPKKKKNKLFIDINKSVENSLIKDYLEEIKNKNKIKFKVDKIENETYFETNNILNDSNDEIENKIESINYINNYKILYNQEINGEKNEIIKFENDIFNIKEKENERRNFKQYMYLLNLRNKINKV